MTESRTDVYSKAWSTICMFLLVLCFTWMAWCMSQTAEPWRGTGRVALFLTRLTGYITLSFLLWVLCVCFVSGIQTLILRRPLARIYDDRLEYLVPLKFRYEIVPYIDVNSFALFRVSRVPIMSVKYIKKKGVETSIRGDTRPRVSEVCELLNAKLAEYWQQPVLSECLDFDSVSRRLMSMGVERSKYDFGAVSRPECMILKRTKKGFRMMYIDESGCRLRRGYFKTECDACHALLAHFLREDALRKSAESNM